MEKVCQLPKVDWQMSENQKTAKPSAEVAEKVPIPLTRTQASIYYLIKTIRSVSLNNLIGPCVKIVNE